ncbi:hypothetical protein BCR44DRAFT_1444904 [Catenaria anguillulae PL171]|uniref:Uncharacterized protein n=1 Tax=Catenaria anguillulae PL171 TaxID=765915 RepID=A0A1Y2H7A4_9FUNG|nr:hypothetical protein BCR44DRAFT_1444904 [Catenaria anguillulae PL171]
MQKEAAAASALNRSSRVGASEPSLRPSMLRRRNSTAGSADSLNRNALAAADGEEGVGPMSKAGSAASLAAISGEAEEEGPLGGRINPRLSRHGVDPQDLLLGARKLRRTESMVNLRGRDFAVVRAQRSVLTMCHQCGMTKNECECAPEVDAAVAASSARARDSGGRPETAPSSTAASASSANGGVGPSSSRPFTSPNGENSRE